jgi:hypothetical protein
MPLDDKTVSGLTITSCNIVYIMEPSISIALEAQMANRVHRTGQTMATACFVVVAEGTVDEHVVEYRKGLGPADSTTKVDLDGWWKLICGRDR